MKKFELTKNKQEWCSKVLFQIKALVDGKFFKKGELGGWLEKEENLDHDGDAWVSGKLKLSVGFYFGMQYKKEKILKLKTEGGNHILWKK